MDFYNQFEQPARIRFAHQASMVQPVDIYINDRPILRGLTFRQSTQFIPIPRGTYNIKVFTTSNNQLLLNQNLTIDGNKLITITTRDQADTIILKITDDTDQMLPQFGMGQPGMMPQFGMEQPGMMPQFGMEQPGMMPQFGMEQPGMMPQFGMGQAGMMPQFGMGQPGMMPQFGMQPDWMSQDLRDQTSLGRARIRVIHFSPNASTIDITTPDGNVLFRNVPYRAVADYISIAPGTYTLQIRPAGMDQVLLTIPNLVLNPNDVKSIYAIGILNGVPAFEAVVFDDRLVF